MPVKPDDQRAQQIDFAFSRQPRARDVFMKLTLEFALMILLKHDAKLVGAKLEAKLLIFLHSQILDLGARTT
jgi:hypothetical protein